MKKLVTESLKNLGLGVTLYVERSIGLYLCVHNITVVFTECYG